MLFIEILIKTIGGLGLFILGMKTMTEGLQMAAGPRIKKILCALSANRVIGCGTGALVTAMVQSSSAATVMLIGFVSAGLLSLHQAVGVILGANIGTTVTSQLIAFKLSSLSLPAIALGVSMRFFAKQKKFRYIGEVVLGFGLLFLGMETMTQGLKPLRTDPTFLSFFTRFDPSTMGGLLLCVLTGALLTMAVQSSSATVGLTMTMATQGLLSFPAAIALVLGENIGTTITAELATLGTTNIEAHRAARAHTLFNVIGVGLMVLIFPHFVTFVEKATLFFMPGVGPADAMVNNEYVNIGRYLANGHTLFNITNAMVFLIFLPTLVRVAIKFSPKKKENRDAVPIPEFNDFYDESPIAALTQVRSEILKMAKTARKTLENVIPAIKHRDPDMMTDWKAQEKWLDQARKEITHYLIKIYQLEINEESAKEIHSFFRMANNIEKIGDAVEHLAHLSEKLFENKLLFSNHSIHDLEDMSKRVLDFLDLIIEQIPSPDRTFMQQAYKHETGINLQFNKMRMEKIQRLQERNCSIEPGLWYIDIMAYLERIGGYCFNIAQAIAGQK
ncbi:MAG: Na/Pi cotransporter family protein [Pedobacter sp.]